MTFSIYRSLIRISCYSTVYLLCLFTPAAVAKLLAEDTCNRGCVMTDSLMVMTRGDRMLDNIKNEQVRQMLQLYLSLFFDILSILSAKYVKPLFLVLFCCPRHSLLILPLLLAEWEGWRTAHPLHGKQFKEREEVRRCTDVSDSIKGR